MDKRLWLLRAIADYTLIVTGLFSILNWWGWSAALLLAAYTVLVIVTELEIRTFKENEETDWEEEDDDDIQMFCFPLDGGEVYVGTKSGFKEFMKKRAEENGKTERPEDTV